jgi:hypothetical protein
MHKKSHHNKSRKARRVLVKAAIALALIGSLTSCTFGVGVLWDEWQPFEIVVGALLRTVVALLF